MHIKDFQESSYFFKNPIIIRIWLKKNQFYRSITLYKCERVDFHKDGKIIVASCDTYYSYFIGEIERFELLKGLKEAIPLFENLMKRNFSFNYNKIW